MFFRDDSNRGETLTKGQRGYISDIIADALKRIECSGDLLKEIDALFEIYKEVNDGGQPERLKNEEEAEARANKYGVLVLGEQKTEKSYIYSRYEYAEQEYNHLVKAYANDENIVAIKVVIYDSDGTEKDVIREYEYNR